MIQPMQFKRNSDSSTVSSVPIGTDSTYHPFMRAAPIQTIAALLQRHQA